ncbi:hypothetical protein OU995_16990 [Roseateles sp. SL47]|nr:hypothetical protein [Roseateles sp. SL47]WAC71281.1 hypothetical protein OU995_16990 [Roseateles sp. SL47]
MKKDPKVFLPIPDGFEAVYTAYITREDGTRLYAKQFGKKAFRLVVPKK